MSPAGSGLDRSTKATPDIALTAFVKGYREGTGSFRAESAKSRHPVAASQTANRRGSQRGSLNGASTQAARPEKSGERARW